MQRMMARRGARRLLPAILAALVAGAATLPLSAEVPPWDGTLKLGRFGTVYLYRPSAEPTSVALFVSGDGGWHLGVLDMARAIASQGALVVGIDIRHYLEAIASSKESCTYAAADFQALGQYVERKLGLPRYRPPVLIGYSSGATLVYATLVQAPVNTFPGAISMGFCPDLPLEKPFCKGDGLTWGPGPKGKGYSFLPAARLEAPWIAFQGQIDKVCPPAAVDEFVARTAGARVVKLAKVGHGFGVESRWVAQFAAAYGSLVAEKPAAPKAPEAGETKDPVSDLPLVEVPSSGGGDRLAVFLSGDGGWATIDRTISERLAAAGIPVAGWNSLEYYWTARSPEVAAADLARILRHYLAAWHKDRALVVGYSFGADVLPALVNRLPADLRPRVQSIALIGLGPSATFEFHVADWLGGDSAAPTGPELARLEGTPIQCFYGSEEADSPCRTLRGRDVQRIELPGGHHLGGAYDAIAEAILGAPQPGVGPLRRLP